MICYIDSSVILRHILTGDEEFNRLKEFSKSGSSELLYIECKRVFHRYRFEGELTDRDLEKAVIYFQEIYDALYIFEISSRVKQRAAESFPTIIGTLDAIHLATALLWSEREKGIPPLVIFTHDEQMKTCAHSMGIHTV